MDKGIIQQAFDECMEEMYNKAWPAASWKDLVERYKKGEFPKDVRIYERYYLPHEEFKYILNKYIKKYGMESKWVHYCNIIIEDLTTGYVIEKYIEPEGDCPGYRGYEDKPCLLDQIQELLKKEGRIDEDLSDKITELVFQCIKDRRDFYRFDRLEGDFSSTIALGASPTGNKRTVEEYWESQGVKLPPYKEKCPLLYWEYDEYDDEMDEIMTEEYGENWEEIWWDKYNKNKINNN